MRPPAAGPPLAAGRALKESMKKGSFSSRFLFPGARIQALSLAFSASGSRPSPRPSRTIRNSRGSLAQRDLTTFRISSPIPPGISTRIARPRICVSAFGPERPASLFRTSPRARTRSRGRLDFSFFPAFPSFSMGTGTKSAQTARGFPGASPGTWEKRRRKRKDGPGKSPRADLSRTFPPDRFTGGSSRQERKQRGTYSEGKTAGGGGRRKIGKSRRVRTGAEW